MYKRGFITGVFEGVDVCSMLKGRIRKKHKLMVFDFNVLYIAAIDACGQVQK